MNSLRKYRGEQCLNCGHPLDVSDKYCPQCGQLNSDKKLSAKDMLIEFLGSIFSYDSKLFVSLRALLFSPAKLTKEYISGKRVKYVNPFRVFISMALLFFIVSSLTSEKSNIKFAGQTESEEIKNEIFKDLSQINDSIKQKRIQKDSISKKDEKPGIYDALEENPNLTFQEVVNKYGFKNTTTDEFRFLLNKNAQKITKNSDAFIDFIKSKFPFFMFIFIPIATLILKLLYIRREYTYTDHLVFNYYLSSTFFFLLILSSFVTYFIDDSLVGISFFFLFTFYVIKAFKLFYAQSYFKTIVKLTIFTILYSILLLIFVILYLMLLVFLF